MSKRKKFRQGVMFTEKDWPRGENSKMLFLRVILACRFGCIERIMYISSLLP